MRARAARNLARFFRPLVLVGAGKMGAALLEGWLRSGSIRKMSRCSSRSRRRRSRRLRARGIALNPTPQTLTDVAAIVIAVKPQVAADRRSHRSRRCLADRRSSCRSWPAARCNFFRRALPPLRFRARHAEYAGRDRPRHHRRGAASRRCGAARPRRPAARRDRDGRVDRRRSADGCGDGGVRLGAGLCVPARRSAGASRHRSRAAADLAAKLARETVAGSGELLHRSPLDAAVLRENVTSPGGTTAAALAVLMGKDGLAPLMARAVAAATARSRELAG